MAIEIKAKRTINWFPVLMSGIFIAFFVIVSYFFFFNPPPLIEYLQPTIDPQTARVVGIQIDPDIIQSNPVFKGLVAVSINLDRLDDPGRANPFIPFSSSTIRFPLQPATSTPRRN